MNVVKILIMVMCLCYLAQSFHTRKIKQAVEYDVAIIGAGSAGISFSSSAKRQGMSVVLFDFVEPTIHGTKWGVGGTCANVGCVPKKLFHQAAILKQHLLDAPDLGWDIKELKRENQADLKRKFCWCDLVQRVSSYIRWNAFGYQREFESSGIKYINALATLIDAHTVLYSNDTTIIKKFLETGVVPEIHENTDTLGIYKVKNVVIATGGRPRYLDIKGKELAITSDDIFLNTTAPGKTLIVGGGYVAMEIAGFLTSFGYNTSLMVRSEVLRNFDRDMVKRVTDDLIQRKVNINYKSVPTELKQEGKEILVTYCKLTKNSPKDCIQEYFDTVIFAIGRAASTKLLNLEKLGIKTNPKNNKIVTQKSQLQYTGVPGVYALGDVLDGVPELSSSAQKIGNLLAKRIAHRLVIKKLQQKQYLNTFLDFKDFPTTIFTPLEYSSCGMTQEQAIKELGNDKIHVYHSVFLPLEEGVLNKFDQEGEDYRTSSYIKVITNLEGKVYGLHYVGPHAGEVMQGYAVAMRMGLTKQDLERTIGIHPTGAEQFVLVRVTKQSGQDFQKSGCCG